MAGRIAVIGAGWAGLAAAVELAADGIAVDVFEASHTLGGRARALETDGVRVDNGAHILVGAYRESLRLMDKVGVPATALRRTTLRLEFPCQMKIRAPQWPAPLHMVWALLTARGLSLTEKLAAIRFMRCQQKRDFSLATDMSAADLFLAHRQPERVRRFLWEPLCLAALNTPVAAASAQVFLNVLRDSLAADRSASDLLLPTTDFSSLFPDPAAGYIAARGGRVLRATRINAITQTASQWTLLHAREVHGPYNALILAIAPYHLPALLRPHPEFTPLCQQLECFAWQPIVTCYLFHAPETRLPAAMLGMTGSNVQWLFDRGELCGQHGLIAAVISGDGPHRALGHNELAMEIHGEIAALLPGLPVPRRHHVIEEKRATFACAPDLARPPGTTACPNVWLAGDYVAGDYPATLEGAVRSGVAAARLASSSALMNNLT